MVESEPAQEVFDLNKEKSRLVEDNNKTPEDTRKKVRVSLDLEALGKTLQDKGDKKILPIQSSISKRDRA